VRRRRPTQFPPPTGRRAQSSNPVRPSNHGTRGSNSPIGSPVMAPWPCRRSIGSRTHGFPPPSSDVHSACR
jgi:hypothetical protein